MQVFLRALRRWVPHIKRVTYCNEVTLKRNDRGEVTLVAKWNATKASPEGEHSIFFSRMKVLGRTATKSALHQRPVKKICRFADDVAEVILRARGV